MNKEFIEMLYYKTELTKDYTSLKVLIRFYKITFFAIALFFFLLTAVVTKKTTNWTCSLLFANASLIKMGICLFSSLFGFISLTLSFLLSPEREALSGIAKESLKNLKKTYGKLKIENKFHPLSLGSKRVESKKLSHTFSHYIDLIEKKKMEAFLMIKNIKKRKDFDVKGREQLINHALHHFRGELTELVKSFPSEAH